MEHIHLIGISGTGLSAIARVLLERGVTVSGSDRQLNYLADGLASMGARISTGHNPTNINGATLVVRSSAIPDDNSEVQAAVARGIPVLKRSEFLPYLLEDDEVLAVAGTHGKTTTTAMLAWMLKALGEDPSYIIGSVAHNLGSNAHAGEGRNFVIEADEYDLMFLGLSPTMAVITTIEHDHPDFFPTPEDFLSAFHEFVNRLQPGGKLIVNQDDPGVRELLAHFNRKDITVYTYSILDENTSYYAAGMRPETGTGFGFQFFAHGTYQADIALQIPGQHNVSNALGALAVVNQLHLPAGRAAGALSAFKGTARRFQIMGNPAGIILIDDYAHHPTEVKATLQAAGLRYPGCPLWAVWQPHTFSRTRQLLDQFSRSFDAAAHVIVTPIYAARETPPPDGFSASDAASAIQHPDVTYMPSLRDAASMLLAQVSAGDIILVLSAGDADQVTQWVLAALQQPEKENHG